jgi:hypothetical protein
MGLWTTGCLGGETTVQDEFCSFDDEALREAARRLAGLVFYSSRWRQSRWCPGLLRLGLTPSGSQWAEKAASRKLRI